MTGGWSSRALCVGGGSSGKGSSSSGRGAQRIISVGGICLCAGNDLEGGMPAACCPCRARCSDRSCSRTCSDSLCGVRVRAARERRRARWWMQSRPGCGRASFACCCCCRCCSCLVCGALFLALFPLLESLAAARLVRLLRAYLGCVYLAKPSMAPCVSWVERLVAKLSS